MRLIPFIAAIAAAALLTSCGNTPPPKEVYLTKYALIGIPGEFKNTVEVPPPPFTPEGFGAMTSEQREDALSKYATKLQYQLGAANIKTRKLAEWERLQRELYSSKLEDWTELKLPN